MDVSIFNLINGLSRKWQILDWTGIFFAEYAGYFLILYFLILLFKQEKIREKIYFFSFVSLSLILSRGIIAEAMKFFISRSRPFSILNLQPLIDANGVDASMPSGHATFYFALAMIIFFFNKKAGWRFFAASFLMGVARIFTGVHWTTDILAGAAIGIFSVLLVKYLISSYSVTKQP